MAVGDPLRWPRDILYSQKLATTSSSAAVVGQYSSFAD
jgi:hypothetical protein